MYSIETIEEFFLSKAPMSPKKLQKLLYYAYAWTLALLNDDLENIRFKLFNDPIQAWVHGPVIPSVYFKYCDHGWDDIPMVTNVDLHKIGSDILDILNQVWDVYGKYTGNQLEAISHREDPWKLARGSCSASEACTNVISDEQIFIYYNNRAKSNG